MAALSFGGYVYFNPDTPLTAEKIFVSLTLIDIMRLPINMIPYALSAITVKVSGQAFIAGIVVRLLYGNVCAQIGQWTKFSTNIKDH